MKGMNHDVREHMAVFGSCGTQLGTVDRVEGDQIKLAKSGPNSDGQHHWIPMSWVASTDGAVRLSVDCGEARKQWRTESMSSGAMNNLM